MKTSRIARVIENMNREGLEQILITSTPAIYYLTGKWISPGERMLALYLSSEGEVRLYANRLFALSGEADLPLYEYDDTEDPVALLAPAIHAGKLGVDRFWPSGFAIRLMEARPELRLCLGSAPVEQARMCKDAEEIALMRAASRATDNAIAATIAEIREGMSETELENIFTGYARRFGDGNSFSPITCFGPNCAEPHHDNDETCLKRGDSIIIDVGVIRNRYCGDMTRTLFFGEASDEQKKVYELVRTANAAGRAAVHPGEPMCNFDRAARKVIEDAGYGEYFIHRTGHGIGLEVHEHPDNSAVSRIIAQPGMCFSVEPGVYLPGKFGVRVEDLVCVTENGCETLNTYPKDLTIL